MQNYKTSRPPSSSFRRSKTGAPLVPAVVSPLPPVSLRPVARHRLGASRVAHEHLATSPPPSLPPYACATTGAPATLPARLRKASPTAGTRPQLERPHPLLLLLILLLPLGYKKPQPSHFPAFPTTGYHLPRRSSAHVEWPSCHFFPKIKHSTSFTSSQ